MTDRYETKTKTDPYKLDPLERSIWVAAFAAGMAKPFMMGVNNSPFRFADEAVNRFREEWGANPPSKRRGIGAENDSGSENDPWG